jgi:hypothetical protein
MNVGIICEGTTDYEVLTVVVQQAIAPKIPTFSLLQPDGDRLAMSSSGPVSSGWQAVRKFVQTSEAGLRLGSFDLVVVHVDADIEAHVEGALAREAGDEPGGLDALCRHVKGWMRADPPANTVIVLPRMSVEAWLVALHTHHKDVEAFPDPAAVLADKGLLPRRENKVEKKRMAFRKLAEGLPALIKDRRSLNALPELERFVGKVASRHRELLRAERGSST